MPWREEVNRLLLRDYYVDLGMAGIDDEYLRVHYGMNQMPADSSGSPLSMTSMISSGE